MENKTLTLLAGLIVLPLSLPRDAASQTDQATAEAMASLIASANALGAAGMGGAAGAAFAPLVNVAAKVAIQSAAGSIRMQIKAGAVQGNTKSFTVDFTCADKSQDVRGTKDCLAAAGISVVGPTAGTRVIFVDNADVYGGDAAEPKSGRMLMQADVNGAISYTLEFATARSKIVVRRPKLKAGPHGITHPKWSAVALDKGGKELSRVGEDMIRSDKDVAAKRFTLKGSAIKSVRFESDGRLDGKPFTAFSAVLVDELSLEN